MAKQPNLIDLIRTEVQREVKTLKRQKFKLKMKILFTLVLPVLIVLLTIEVTKTYMRIKLKSMLAPAVPNPPSVPRPAQAQRSKPEFITPQPVPSPDVQQTVQETVVLQPTASEPVIPIPADPIPEQHVTITEITEDV